MAACGGPCAGGSVAAAALLFVSSALLRMGIVVAGFYFVSNGRWQRLLACLAGFIIARLAVTWITRGKKHKEDPHAPES